MPVKQYRCEKGFSWPARSEVRERIANGDHMPMEERGPWDRKQIGDTMKKKDLPAGVFATAVRRGFLEMYIVPEEE